MILNRKSVLSAAILASTCLLASHQAEAALFHFDINTGVLNNASGNPFALDFTLISGGSFSNTISISNFVFTGGTATGSTTPTGSVSGDLGSSITLTSGTNFFNDLYQSFSNGTTDIKFDVNTTTILGGTPDNFSVSILDNNAVPLFTTDATNSTLAALEIHTNTGVDPIVVSTFQSVAPSPAGVTVTVVPEPASSAGLIGGLGMLLAYRRRGQAAIRPSQTLRA
jgi:hypothetical protein